MTQLDLSQKKIIIKIKNYLKKLKSHNIEISKSSFCYFNTYSESPGFALANLWNRKISKIEFFIYIFKNIYSIFFISNYKVSSIPNFKFENIIITWGKLKDFKKKIFKDNFSNTASSTTHKTLFFVIYLDKKIPKNIPDNVVLFFREREKIDIYFFFKRFISVLFTNNFSFTKFFHYFSSHTIFAEEIRSKLINSFNFLNIKKIIMPYEAQPFQNYIFKEVKKINKKIKTIGFIHSMVPAFPINFLKRDGSPDELLLSGEAQLSLFIKYLNWKKENLKIIYSPRISKYIDKKNINSIFFPISIESKKIILHVLENYILSKKDKFFKNINIKKHPSSLGNKEQNILKEDITKLINNNKNKFNKKSNNTLNFFIGPTSAFIQYLENNQSCIHITTNPVFDVYTFGLWKKLFPKQINKYMYNYKLYDRNKMILMKKRSNKSLLKNII